MNRIRKGWFVRRLTIGLLVLFSLGFADCDRSEDFFGLPIFYFVSPEPTLLDPTERVGFELRTPFGLFNGRLSVTLDEEPIPAGDLVRGGNRVTGDVAVSGGTHRLAAELPIRFLWFFRYTLEAWTTFDVPTVADFEVRESIEQLHITHARPDRLIELHDADGELVDAARTDEQGSLIFRLLTPGPGYRLVTDDDPPAMAGPFTVAAIEGSTPSQGFYDGQLLEPEDPDATSFFTYITARDGTRLSVFVSLPGPISEGPYPTLVNYSGYSPSQPGEPVTAGNFPLCDAFREIYPVLCAAPNHPSGIVAGLMGYATVGMNKRGTGCSGGAYDFFEPLQVLDGYDLVETVAAQSWVARNEVGMVGLSYPGITQLFTAQTQPPSLVAIAPLSILASTTASTLAPGGILNNGFAIEWGQQVLDRADPYGQGWEQGRVDAGDTQCAENQLLHSQKVDIIEKAFSFPWYVPEIMDELSPILFADRFEIPIFTSGSWQDEQTGGHFPAIWDKFVNAPIVRRQGFNGAHPDGFAPHTLVEWKTFLDFYVAKEIRPLDPIVGNLAPDLFGAIFGSRVSLPAERFASYASYEEGLAAYEAEDPIRILFEVGANGDFAPVESFEMRFSEWPPAETTPRRWYFHQDGSLRDFTPSETESASGFLHDPDKGQETLRTIDGGTAPAIFGWSPDEDGEQVAFVSEPLTEDLVMVGTGSVDLWLQSDATEADLEAVLSEVRPDDQEMYVQSGWLRASQRALAPEATPLQPVKTHLEVDAAPVPQDGWTEARVELFAFGHVFRAGSRIRISVETPGGNRARWKFLLADLAADVEHRISHSAAFPSSVLLPIIPDVEVPTELPPCSLRAQPCRAYVPHTNRVVE